MGGIRWWWWGGCGVAVEWTVRIDKRGVFYRNILLFRVSNIKLKIKMYVKHKKMAAKF